MTTNRREFLGRFTAGAALFGTMPLSLEEMRRALTPPVTNVQEQWDLSWVARLTGKHKSIFDVPEIESGYGVWRATIWQNQYQQVLGVAPRDLSAVVVLRHNGIWLAMQQAFWDRYGVGERMHVTHPITQKPTKLNPVLLTAASGEVPAQLEAVALDKFIARGGIALACQLAFDDVIEAVRTTDNVTPEEAKKRAVSFLLPGVVLQPSGVFAAIRAQEAGCTYLRAS
jgi:hypothetical protein